MTYDEHLDSARQPRTLWVAMRCGHTRRDLVATFERTGSTWNLVATDLATYSRSPLALGHGIAGEFAVAHRYPGCCDCRANSCARCGKCERLGCWRSEQPYFDCGWCGSHGEVSGRIQSLSTIDHA